MKTRIFVLSIYERIMQKLELKDIIKTNLDTADDRLLRIIQGVMENYYEENENNKIIGFSIKGEPLTKAKYIQRIKEAEKNIEGGNFTSHEDLLNEMKKW